MSAIIILNFIHNSTRTLYNIQMYTHKVWWWNKGRKIIFILKVSIKSFKRNLRRRRHHHRRRRLRQQAKYHGPFIIIKKLLTMLRAIHELHNQHEI